LASRNDLFFQNDLASQNGLALQRDLVSQIGLPSQNGLVSRNDLAFRDVLTCQDILACRNGPVVRGGHERAGAAAAMDFWDLISWPRHSTIRTRNANLAHHYRDRLLDHARLRARKLHHRPEHAGARRHARLELSDKGLLERI
jgi:hypothetical protein